MYFLICHSCLLRFPNPDFLRHYSDTHLCACVFESNELNASYSPLLKYICDFVLDVLNYHKYCPRNIRVKQSLNNFPREKLLEVRRTWYVLIMFLKFIDGNCWCVLLSYLRFTDVTCADWTAAFKQKSSYDQTYGDEKDMPLGTGTL